jgi:hypothetical protein
MVQKCAHECARRDAIEGRGGVFYPPKLADKRSYKERRRRMIKKTFPKYLRMSLNRNK